MGQLPPIARSADPGSDETQDQQAWEGHQRPIPMPAHDNVIRRFVNVRGGDYTTYVGSKEQMFSMQSARPTYDRSGGETLDQSPNLSPESSGVIRQVKLPQYKVVSPDAPPLLLSDDGTMAVPAQDGKQSKVLFAVDEVINDANNRLTAAGSLIRLGKTGNSVGVTHNDEFHLLHQVKPYAAANGPTASGEWADFGLSLCINMATNVVSGIHHTQGNTRRVLLGTGGAPERMDYGITTGTTIDNVRNLAEAITQPTFNPNANVSGQVTGTNVQQTTGQTYGTALGGGTLNVRSQTLGINQYANPDVGEAFSTNSIMTALDNTVNTDFATGRVNMDTWGYHFAGVVAKSLDGHDYVTLENYNRSKEIVTDALTSIVRQRVRAIGQTVAAQLLLAIQNDPGTGTTAITEILQHAFGFNEGDFEAAAEIQQHLNRVGKEGVLWFFAMYGSNPGQTFHEQQASSGAYNNPITVRVGHQNAPVVPGLAPTVALHNLTITSGDVETAGGRGEGGWGTLKVSSRWKRIYNGVAELERRGYTVKRVETLLNNILSWQVKNDERAETNDDQKRDLLNRLRPEVEQVLSYLRNQ